MKNLRTWAIAAMLLGSPLLPASAADIPAAGPVRAPVAFAPTFTWTGFYIGANAGYGWGKVSDTAGGSTDLDGPIVGGQVGYNWQSGALVLGLEGDFQGSWQEDTITGTILGVPVSVTTEIPWFATARARAGYAWDRHLLYVTGGAAWVNLKMSATALGTTVSSDDTKIAWTVGGGWEWAFFDRWSAKAEYLYLDTGDTDITLFGATISGSGHNHIFRGGINYRF